MTSPWLNKNTMTTWLKIPVKEIRIQGENETGGNYMSTLKKITAISIDGESIDLIVKLQNLSGTTETIEVFKNTNIFVKEEEMYRNTIARLYDIICEAYPGEYEPFAPQYYHVSKDFLVMEDLTARGFRMPDAKVGLDLEQSLLVMSTLAKFHAASVILHQRNPQAFDKFNVLLYQEPDLFVPYGNHVSGLALTLADELANWGKEWHKYVGKLRYLATNFLSRAGEVATKRSGFNVLNHGDLWVHNMMFKNGSAGIRLLDFQTVYFGSPAVDLNYFIATSPSFEVRANHMERLIEEYHKTLCNTLTALKYEGKLITLEELQQEIDKKALFGLFSLIGPCALMQCDPDKQFSFDESLSKGINPGPSIYSETYKKNVKLMLPFYDSKAAFAFDV
ncbi:hypothetical protein C0J52_14468 [Blattella germanica]|nr:hypothetical protein C0J52_14468 [Blattella germanica]